MSKGHTAIANDGDARPASGAAPLSPRCAELVARVRAKLDEFLPDAVEAVVGVALSGPGPDALDLAESDSERAGGEDDDDGAGDEFAAGESAGEEPAAPERDANPDRGRRGRRGGRKHKRATED